jgi:glycerol-3-phosphate dehydrogenase (NAD(P)+)
LTCTSEKSRNYTVGYRVGKGEKLEDIIKSLGSVAEGVTTTKAAYEMALRLKIEAPIVTEVYHVLYNGKPIQDAIDALIGRKAHPEFKGII